MSAAPLSVALVLGSRELQATDAAERWALAEVAGWVAGFGRRPDLVLTADGRGCGSIVRRYATGGRLRFDVWTLRGEVLTRVDVRRWWHGEVPDDPRWPLRRAAAMIAHAEGFAAEGGEARALVLRAPWDPGGGERWAADIARKARLDTTELECPAAYGPPADVGGPNRHDRNA